MSLRYISTVYFSSFDKKKKLNLRIYSVVSGTFRLIVSLNIHLGNTSWICIYRRKTKMDWNVKQHTRNKSGQFILCHVVTSIKYSLFIVNFIRCDMTT